MLRLISFIFFLFVVNSFAIAQVGNSLWNQEQISNITILLYQPQVDTSGVIGSGTIVNHQGKYYLLTAGHVAKEMKNDAKLVFRLNGDKPDVVDLLLLVKDNLLKWKNHSIADLSLIELIAINEDIKNRFQNFSFPSSSIQNGKALPEREADLTFLGYPIVDLEMEHFSPLIFTANLSSGLITQLRYDTKTKCNFFYLNVPSIQGCSGSGVFYSVKKAMYYGGDKTIMIGVVHGTQGDNTGGKLAAITPSYYIFDLLTN